MNTTTAPTGGLSGYAPILRRRAGYIAVIAPLFILLTVYLSFALTPLYQSTATILMEASSVDQKVVTTTVMSAANSQIEIVQGRVMTIAMLKDLIKEFDPYPGSPMTPGEKAQQLLEDTTLERVDPVTLKPLQDSNAFSLHYRNPDKERAAEVASRLAKLFLTYNQKSREQAAEGAAKFLASQAEDVSKQMRAIDEEIKVFKNAHGDALPEYIQRNEASLDRVQHELENLQQQILQSEEKESLLAVQLSQTSPNMITNAGDLTDMPTVRAKLAEAQQRYTPDHPEVKRLKEALRLLSEEQKLNGSGVVANANNPLYMTTASQLVSVRKELQGFRAQAARKTAEADQYEIVLRKTPGVEREYSDIVRRRTALQNTYQGIQDKLQNAQIAQNFESEQGGERFTLIRAPSPGKLPVYPNRIGLILLGVVLGGLFSGIAVAIAESSDTNVRDVGDLPVLGDALVLAAIPRISNSRDRRLRRLKIVSLAAAYSLAVVFVGAVVISAVN
ncbi:MAG TPA: Wzz/FepE/Etk N-terminal domain-containing protein [Steroidobacteraceae bacterium]|nr:Wzz/FepE/Etk N-terminal domain-containing protein [Steroidobacteraceae bacterium]